MSDSSSSIDYWSAGGPRSQLKSPTAGSSSSGRDWKLIKGIRWWTLTNQLKTVFSLYSQPSTTKKCWKSAF